MKIVLTAIFSHQNWTIFEKFGNRKGLFFEKEYHNKRPLPAKWQETESLDDLLYGLYSQKKIIL